MRKITEGESIFGMEIFFPALSRSGKF